MKTVPNTHTNNLSRASSPYLLQHVDNPVDWYEWGADALNKAKAENKPIFLSIGYSSCHWCHVMAHESFANEVVAAVMNENFINIKVDREEHPELDEIYMTAVQSLTGSGGWPLSVWLTPDLKPFYGGTYFPPEDYYGRPGFRRVLLSLAEAWKDQQGKVVESAEDISQRIQQSMQIRSNGDQLSPHLLEDAFNAARRSFDVRHGGFDPAPKFPHAMELSFLLRFYQRESRPEALEMVEKSLLGMAAGGIYDHLGGGFHRYSTDDRWLVPHFEKMLYDQALLVRAYAEAYLLTQKPLFRNIAFETLDYVLTRMTGSQGEFFSAEDADSDSKEGAYYVWEWDELQFALGADAEIFGKAYGASSEGNWEGTNILYRPREWHYIAKELNLSEDAFAAKIQECRTRLLLLREKRIPPLLDDKVLTDWNGLMLSAFAAGYRLSGEQKYLLAAENAARFLKSHLVKHGDLLHSYRQNQTKSEGFLSDDAFLISGLLDLYQLTFSLEWFDWAKELLERSFTLFADAEGGFYYTAEAQPDLIARSKNPFDNATPSGNSVMVRNLLRFANITDDQAYYRQAMQTLESFAGHLHRYPQAYSEMLIAYDYALGPARQIVLAGNPHSPMVAEMLRSIHRRFLPRTEIVCNDDTDEVKKDFPHITDKRSRNGQPLAYVCEHFTCLRPASSVAELEPLLQA